MLTAIVRSIFGLSSLVFKLLHKLFHFCRDLFIFIIQDQVYSMVHFYQNLPCRCYFVCLILSTWFVTCWFSNPKVVLYGVTSGLFYYILIKCSCTWHCHSLHPWFSLRKGFVSEIYIIHCLFLQYFLGFLQTYLRFFCILLLNYNAIIYLGGQPVGLNREQFFTLPCYSIYYGRLILAYRP